MTGVGLGSPISCTQDVRRSKNKILISGVLNFIVYLYEVAFVVATSVALTL